MTRRATAGRLARVTAAGPIGDAFEAARDEGRAALMPYMMAGYPDRETSLAVAGCLRRCRGRPDRARGSVLGSAGRRADDSCGGDRRAGGRGDVGDGARGLPVGRRADPGRADGLLEHGARPRRRRGVRPAARSPPGPPGRSSPTCRWARRRRSARISPPPGWRWCRWSRRRPRPSAGPDLRRRPRLRLRRLDRRDDRRAGELPGRAGRPGRGDQGRRGDSGRGRLRDRHRRRRRPRWAGSPTA